MPKYAPLSRFLRRRRHDDEIRLSFAEIERIIGAILPKAAADLEWWSNTPATGRRAVQRLAWLDVGYLAAPEPGESVVFRRARRAEAASRPSEREATR